MRVRSSHRVLPGMPYLHVVDPDPRSCEAVSLLFRLEGYQTGFSLDLPGFLATLERRRPDLVILAFRLGSEADGVQVLRRLRHRRLAAPVLLIGEDPPVEAVVRAIKAGAVDVVPKPIDGERLLDAAEEALRQRWGLPRRSARQAIELSGFAQLTRRERQVLQLVTNGQSNKEAGRELGISPRTIEVHRARVMEKLGARNTADLIRIVLSE